MKRYYDNLEEETKAVKNYVENTPYYSYEVMFAKLPINEKIDYGMINHLVLKCLYENLTDKEKVGKCLTLLYRIGGEKGLINNFYSICNYSPLRNHMVTKSWAICLEHYFDKITNGRLRA